MRGFLMKVRKFFERSMCSFVTCGSCACAKDEVYSLLTSIAQSYISIPRSTGEMCGGAARWRSWDDD